MAIMTMTNTTMKRLTTNKKEKKSKNICKGTAESMTSTISKAWEISRVMEAVEMAVLRRTVITGS